jgi:hypothetical protein
MKIYYSVSRGAWGRAGGSVIFACIRPLIPVPGLAWMSKIGLTPRLTSLDYIQIYILAVYIDAYSGKSYYAMVWNTIKAIPRKGMEK